MGQIPLVIEQIEAGARFLAEFQKYMPVDVAFWLKETDRSAWYLYVASEQITDENFDVVYSEVGQIIVDLHDPALDMLGVKVIGMEDPLAKATVELRRRWPGRHPIRIRDQGIGGVHAEEMYIYPTPVSVPAQ